MRYTFIILTGCLFFLACKKDQYTTVPQIKFKSFNPDQGSNYNTFDNQPVLILELTDAEGDFGPPTLTDTAMVFIRNTFTDRKDSFPFPDLKTSRTSNFKADIEVGLFSTMGGRNLPSNQRPYFDTLHFEVYVKDFAKNKSNVIVTDKPFIYFTLP